MIKDYINHLHTKPEHYRKKVSYVASGIITLVIGAVWVSSFGYINNQGKIIAETNRRTGVSSSPFSVIKSNLSNAYGAFYDTFSGKVSVTASSSTDGTSSLEYIPQ